MGPLDEPTFPDGSAPEGFWDQSAEQVFKAAREIVDLAETCQNRKKMPMSALVVFAVWTAAFVGIYAWHFPQLDVKHHMSNGERPRREEPGHSQLLKSIADNQDRRYRAATHGPTAIAYTALKSMSNYLHMASTYVRYFHDMDLFYEGVKKDYLAHVNQHGADTSGTTSVRQGGKGGGLDEWKVYGPKVTNNGDIMLAEDTLAECSDLSREGTRSEKDVDPAAELRMSPADDHSLKPRWIAPAGSALATANSDTSDTGRKQSGSSMVDEVVMKGQGSDSVAGAAVAHEDDMHGIVYGSTNGAEGDACFSEGNIGGGSANSDSLQTDQSQHWSQFTQPVDSVQQVSHLDAQNAIPLTQIGSLDSTPPETYLGDDTATDLREYLNVNESHNMRWEEAMHAASIERFAWGGPEVEYVYMPFEWGSTNAYGV
ncbi:MAG: hypothetical protein STHCBS139747_002539 [Sporothrix thermara]